jgi:hypothetical protein
MAVAGMHCSHLCAVYQYEHVFRSRNNLQYGLIHAWRTMVSFSVQVVALADGSCGYVQMARSMKNQHNNYIIQIEPSVYIRWPSHATISLIVKLMQMKIVRL